MTYKGHDALLVVEVAETSVSYDLKTELSLYASHGVREYWVVDARNEPLVFDILRHSPKGYRTTPKKEGWMKSSVFGKSFRLTQIGSDAPRSSPYTKRYLTDLDGHLSGFRMSLRR